MIRYRGLEAARSLFRKGAESPSENPIRGSNRGRNILKDKESIIVKTSIIELAEGMDTGPLLQIRVLEGGGRVIYGGAAAGGERSYTCPIDEFNTASHTRVKRVRRRTYRRKGGDVVENVSFSPPHSVFSFLSYSVDRIHNIKGKYSRY